MTGARVPSGGLLWLTRSAVLTAVYLGRLLGISAISGRPWAGAIAGGVLLVVLGRVWRTPRPSRLAEALAIAVWWLATAAYLYWTRSGLWILGVATAVFLLSYAVRYVRSSPPPEAQELHPGERELERMRPRIP